MTLNRRARWWGVGAAIVLVAGGIAATVMMASSGVGPVLSGPPVTRRLTSVQYQNIIRDVFGGDIDIGGRLPPDLRLEGLLSIGASHVSITAAGMEQYDAMARAIAAQVVDEKHRDMLVRCQPASITAPDEQCAREFLAEAGRLLYRRPLTDRQLETYVTAAADATEITHDFYQGLKLSLSAMLTSPAFLFRVEVVEPDPNEEGAYRLDAYSKASQLSFFLWNSAPDSQLLAAAESGELHTRSGLEEQVERMIDSPRLEAGIRAFFADQLRFTEFATLAKDAQLFPKFNAQVAADAREQTLRTIIDVVLTDNRDFREIFTTKETFLTPALGAIYRVPIYKQGPNGSPDQWQPYEFAADDPRAGILTQVAFTALHSPAGRGSPTIRGKAVREIALCQEVPAPPGDVDFSKFLQASANPTSTARERLSAHASVPSCAGCHKIMDPIGLALENFNGAGGYRTIEGGVQIDASGVLDGIPFENAAGLGEAVYKNPAAVSCVVNRLSERALGRQVTSGERNWLDYLKSDFADNGYRLLALMEEIASSEALYSVLPSQQVASAPVENNREVTQ
ncbi:MAG TPA: DUF1592 domain-containing protein [Woeseiaceae bacterium]|nr:DUF1592 domain-containing protein [Woeseiaceae bacterium]